LTRLADVVTKTIRSISPDALSDRLFRDPLARWWQVYLEKLSRSGYEGDVQSAFFITTFVTMGHVAKCDGRVKPVEVELAAHMKLNKEQKELAIRLFNEGKHKDFALDALLQNFKRDCGHRMSVVQAFLEIQFKMAYADACLNEKESKLIKRIFKRLDISEVNYVRIDRHVRAVKKVASQPVSDGLNKPGTIADAYKILGLSRWATQEQTKLAYRRLMSKFHPDKVVSRGASEVELIEAHDIVYDVKFAYDMITKLKRG